MSWDCSVCGSGDYESGIGCLGCYNDAKIAELTERITRIRELLKVGDVEKALELTSSFEPVLTMEI